MLRETLVFSPICFAVVLEIFRSTMSRSLGVVPQKFVLQLVQFKRMEYVESKPNLSPHPLDRIISNPPNHGNHPTPNHICLAFEAKHIDFTP